MRILLLEDNPGDVRLLTEHLADGGATPFQVTQVDRLAAGIELVGDVKPDVVLLDLSLPDSQGLESLTRMRTAANRAPIVVLTSIDDEALGLRLIQAGAQDYLVKGQVTGPLLTRSLRYAVERVRAEEALREQTRVLHSVLRSMGEGVVVTASDGTPMLLNPAAERILGLSPSEGTSGQLMKWLGFPGPALEADATKTELPFLAVLQGPDVNGVELSMRDKKSSQVTWLSVSGRLMKDDTGAQRGRVIVFRDVTRSKQAEEELRQSEERLRAIMDNSPTLIFLKDMEGRYLQVNRKFEEVFPLASRDLIGKTDEDICPPAQAAAFRANDRKVLEAGVPMEFEEVALHDDGPHTSLVIKFPLVNPQGKCEALCGIATDITDRKRAEEEREKLLNDKLLLLESTGEGIYGLDLQGRCTFVNKAAAKMLGYHPKELLGNDMHALIHHHRLDGLSYPYEECRIYAAFLRGQGFHVDDEGMWRKDGTAFPVEYSSFPIMGRECITGAVVAFTDITERKRTEKQLQDTVDRVRTLSHRLNLVREEERTRIARELHDELGVRLTCLKLDLARLQSVNGKSSLTPDKRVEKIRSMTAEVDATIASVQRLVAELRPGILDDLGLVAAIEWQCQDFERRSSIRCLCEATQEIELNPSCATAAFRICQEAITNVMRHAKATFVRVLLTQVNGDLLLEIQDDGQGISTEKLTDSHSFGLLSMRERARSLGGEVDIVGCHGKGTTVTLRLPIGPTESQCE